jgi:integrase
MISYILTHLKHSSSDRMAPRVKVPCRFHDPGPLVTGGDLDSTGPRRGRRGGDVQPTHDLRRSWISTLLNVGAALVTVAPLAGHANIATTAK